MDRWTVGRAWIVGAGLVWLALAFVVASDPLPSATALSLVLLPLGFAVGVAWVIYSLAWLGVFAAWRRAAVWLTVPFLPLVAAHALRTGWPLAARVWLSESSLRAAAVKAGTDPFEHVDSHKAEPRWVGLMCVRSISARADGMAWFMTGTAYFNEGGILYAPNGLPERRREEPVVLRHLYGPWHRYTIHD